MKKVLTIIVFCLLAVYTQAQSGLTTTSSLTLNNGLVKSSLYVEMKPRMQKCKSTGIVCDLFFYTSYSDMLAGSGRVFPVVGGNVLYNITITVVDADVIKASGVTLALDVQTFIYQKIKAALLAQLSITCA